MINTWRTNEENSDSKLRYCDVQKNWFGNLIYFKTFCEENHILGEHGFLYNIMCLNGEVRLYSYKGNQ